MEIRRQLEAKKAELLRIQQESEELRKKQQEEMKSSQFANRKQFDELCDQTKQKYAEFEEKIKTVERKINKSVSMEFDLNNDVLFKKFIDENLDDDQMHDFIRHECLNLIIARK